MTARQTDRQAWLALAVLMLPVLLVSIDNTALNLALPAIAGDLQPSATQQLWIIDVYPLVLATLLLVMGTLGDRIGRRRLLLVGASGFTVVSAIAAFAPTAELLIAARAAMALFGAALMPPTLALIRTLFPEARSRQVAVAIWAATFSAGSALGPLVGGLLLDGFGWWGAIFLMAVPVMLPLLLLAPRLVPESADPNPGRIDLPSVALSMVTMGPLVLAIKEFAVLGLHPFTIIPLLVGLLAGWLLVRRQRAISNPLIDMSLFAIPTFRTSVAINLLSLLALNGFLFLASQHLQLVLGLSPTRAALVMLPGVVATVVAGLAVVRLVRAIGARIAVLTGLGFTIAGFVAIAIVGSGLPVLALGLSFVLIGIGVGSAETVSNELILASAPPARAGAAAAISESAYETGSVLGTTLLGSIVTAAYRAHLDLPAGLSPADAARAGETLAGAQAVAADQPTGLAAELVARAQYAFESGVAVTASTAAGVMVLAFVLAWFGLRERRTPQSVERARVGAVD